MSASAPGTEEGPLPSGLPPSCLHPPGQVLESSEEGVIQGCPRLEARLCRAHAQGNVLADLA